jgi:hypothetical protein
MTMLDAEQAYRAVVAFLDGLWRRKKEPGELGLFYGMCSYTPGVGTGDPAMWGDWLAAIKRLQTGADVPDPDRDALTHESFDPIVPEQAYLAMFEFIKEYWERVGRPTEIGDLLSQMRYTTGAGTADPEMWKRWLAAVEKVEANR